MLSEQALMDIAGIIGEASTCTRLQVGAILTMNRRIISTGYNGAAGGFRHCYHDDDDDRPCEAAVHAEANVIAFAAKNGVQTWGSILFTTHSPCVTCARLLINAGVSQVIYENYYRDIRGLDELEAGRVSIASISGPLLRPMQDPPGDEPSLHPSEPTLKRPEDIEDPNPPYDNRRSPGV